MEFNRKLDLKLLVLRQTTFYVAVTIVAIRFRNAAGWHPSVPLSELTTGFVVIYKWLELLRLELT